MPDRFFGTVSGLIAAALACGATASGADYRGAAAGWPTYANGAYAANYPANYGNGAAYYVARPMTGGGYAPAGGMAYMPVQAAYANPAYFAAYGRSPTMYRPVSNGGYAPAGGGYYAPTTANYAPAQYAPAQYAPANYVPTTANYAPANSYAVSPAGISSAGSEATAYFGQPTALNYVPPRYAYRPAYAQVPVYMYRPVTAYQPGTGQPVTCMQASTCNTNVCQPQRTRCFSILNPFTWFSRRPSCGTSGCGTSACGAPTTAYCGTAACGQAQPYYPTQPVVPVVPVYPSSPGIPANTIPSLPRGFLPPAGTTIPPPPTVSPGTRGIITTPAETRPSLAPGGGTFTPNPGSFGAPPAGSVTPLPGTTIPLQPGGSFQTAPPPAQPGGFGPGSFGTGTNYAPATDPYSASMTPAMSRGETTSGTTPSQERGAPHSVFGSGYRNGSEANTDATRPEASDGVIRAPGMPALPPSVRTVPDLDEPPVPRPASAAPQLLDPRDKTANRDRRWGVVPAQWPTKERASGQLSQRPVAPRSAHETYEASGLSKSPYASEGRNSARYDDGGWKAAAGL